jgi:hypothetical protein
MLQISLSAGSGILFGLWLLSLGSNSGINYLKERAI